MSCILNRRNVFIALLLTLTFVAFSQELYVANGLTLSSAGEGFNNSKKSYQIDLGINYLKKDWYFLSSNVGYTRKGGDFVTEKFDSNSPRAEHKISPQYITIGTSFNVKKNLKSSYLYLGCGPRVDFKINSTDDNLYIKDVLFGLKCTAGYNYYISDFILGFNINYYPTLTKYYDNQSKRDQTFSLGVVLGYKF